LRKRQPSGIGIAYISRREESICLVVIMNAFTRTIRGWQLGSGLGEEWL